ncbi:zinc-binding dehydrogenase [Kribbella qitaiheensis]|uniref:Zinc-binding dehydrogenase n=1 Tax=Kribbella qitaiheensis TaxID=1544730 RepID=A0A7G6X5V1_9ACTN|nr:zinc-binding dehydrogenase [Kribbella qitaiheensis]QNE21616.1 zinc-binding dehydrogenase [Kribbella qitaiheensis]
MRALLFDEPAADTATTRVAEVPVPEPGPNEVSIDVRAAGVNFIDVMARRGDPGYATGWPFVPGLEVAGTVRALGAGVSGPAVGTPVAAFTGSGGLAEVAVVRAQLVVAIPEGLSFEQAAAAPGTLTTAALLLGPAGRLRKGDSVLVHSAAGGVGQALASLARLNGAGLLLGTVGSASRAGSAEKAGYDAALVRGEGLVEAVRERTGGRGVDLILDPQGTEWIDTDLELVAAGGRIVLFGNAGGTPMTLPAAGRLFGGNVSIGGFSIRGYAANAPELVGEALAEVLGKANAGELSIELTPVDGLERAAEAQQALAEGRGKGKYVVRV